MSQAKSKHTDDLDIFSPKTKRQLQEWGINSIADLSMRTPSNISEYLGISISHARTICAKAQMKLEESKRKETKFVTALDFSQTRSKTIQRLHTGSKSLDELFGGQGIETGAVTQVYGQAKSGKTQICHCLSAIVSQETSEGGLVGPAFYIDTEGTFRPERITQIANTRGFDVDKTQSSIIYCGTHSAIQQEACLKKAQTIIPNNNVKLVIVDSVLNHYKSEYSDLGRAGLSERQQRLNKFLYDLQQIAQTLQVAVVITNHVQSVPDSTFGVKSEPLGGNVLKHACTHIVSLGLSGRNRIATLIKSPYLPDNDVLFTISENGVSDIEY
jgi:DNA repair protein RadA